MKNYIKERIKQVLYNPKALSIVRKSLRHFPSIDEEVRVWVYLLKKKMTITNSPYLMSTQNEGILQNPKDAGDNHQLLIDISELALRDVHTGIQRVVRSILQELLRNPPAGYVIEPVYADAAGQLRYARKFASAMIGKDCEVRADSIVSVNSGDIFYSPDLYLAYPFATLIALRQRGLRVIFTIYDIIALKNPDLFPKALKLGFSDWFSGVMMTADAIVCDSRTVADEVKAWLGEHPGQRNRPLPIGYFHLGADIEASQPTQGKRDEGTEVLAACQSRSTLLMVGTVEPRKGYAQALAAMESLWEAGVDLNLVIVGKEGWRSRRLTQQLLQHPERNLRLFWMQEASDTLLLQLYARSSALLAASLAEGFGLPLIEAARQGLPIIARDIAVFHEVAGEHAFYFHGDNPKELADAIQLWLALRAEGKAPTSRELSWLSWTESTQQLVNVLINHRSYTVWPDEECI